MEGDVQDLSNIKKVYGFPAITRFERDRKGKREFVELNVFFWPGELLITRRGVVGTAGNLGVESPHGELEERVRAEMVRLEAEGYENVFQSDEVFLRPTVESLGERHGLNLPARLRRFLESGELEQHNGRSVRGGLPMWSDDVAFPLRFDHGLLPFVQDLLPDHRKKDKKRFVPLALLHNNGETSEFLATDVTDAACPVFMWYHGSATYYPVSDSLDEFLTGLEGPPLRPGSSRKKSSRNSAKRTSRASTARPRRKKAKSSVRAGRTEKSRRPDSIGNSRKAKASRAKKKAKRRRS